MSAKPVLSARDVPGIGNLTDDGEHWEYTYDPFGRLRKVKKTSDQPLVVEYTYSYSGLGQLRSESAGRCAVRNVISSCGMCAAGYALSVVRPFAPAIGISFLDWLSSAAPIATMPIWTYPNRADLILKDSPAVRADLA